MFSLIFAVLLVGGVTADGRSVKAQPAPLGSAPWVWQQIGPSPIREDDRLSPLLGEGQGGVVFDMAIDPRGITDSVIYLATNGGVWKTTDGGGHWYPKTDSMPSNSTSAVALDPNDPDTVYAGTGALLDPLGINFKAVGLYKSIDGGDHWGANPPAFDDGQPLGGNVFGPPTDAAGNPTCATTRTGFLPTPCGRGIYRIVVGIYRIVVLRGASNVVLVGTNNGLFRSVDGGANFGANSPNFNDGRPILPGSVTDLDLDTSLDSTVYASVAGVGIFRSVDGGATFTRNLLTRPGGPAAATFSTIAFAQSTFQGTVPNNRVMYANVASSSPCTTLTCPPLGIWKSVDYGRNWVRLLAAGLGNCQSICSIDQTIGADPVDPRVVHVGLVSHYVSSDGGRFFVREDAGHVDQVAMAFSPPSHYRAGLPVSTIWLGNHGGVWRGIPETCVPSPPFPCRWDFVWDSKNEGLANLGVVSLDIGRGSAASNAYSYVGVWDHGLASRLASQEVVEIRGGLPGWKSP